MVLFQLYKEVLSLMKRNLIVSLFVGLIIGAALASVIIWIWQTFTHNISVFAVAVTVIVAAAVFIGCQIQVGKSLAKAKRENSNNLKKYQSYFELFSSWMILRNKGRKLSEYFEDNKFKDIAIYGLGKLGICLYEELKSSNINVKYAIDTDAAHFSYMDLKVVSPQNSLEMVDVIVVTPFSEYEKIVDDLRKKISYKVVSLADIVSSV